MTAPPPRPPARSPTLRRWADRLAVGYLVAVGLTAAGMWGLGDDAWLPTVFLFGPRWVLAVPLAGLVPLAVWARARRAGAALAAAAAVVAGPVTGLTLSARAVMGADPDAGWVRVLTCNTQGAELDLTRFRRLLADARPDVVFLQETVPDFPADGFGPGWQADRGPAGLLFASRFPFRRADGPDPGGPAPFVARYAVATPGGEVAMANVHLPTPRDGLEAAAGRSPAAPQEIRAGIAHRAAASRAARGRAAPEVDGVVVAGDFNMPVESRIYRRDWGDLGNAFSAAGAGWGYTKHTRLIGARIDHVVYSPPWRCVAARVGPDVGSDHRPVLADLAFGEP